MEIAFLGCSADVTISFIYTHYRERMAGAEALHLPPDAQLESVCVHDGATV